MALLPLASTTDLPSRWSTHADAQAALDAAQDAIRDAAGGPIGEYVGTIQLDAPSGNKLTLPAPVRTVTLVTLDGHLVTDYRNVGDGLWRRTGWGGDHAPVEVTGTFGLPTVPRDIVTLCTDLAVAWLEHREEGGGSMAGLKAVRIDDASESYTDEASGQVSPVFIPGVTRQWLRARFGGGSAVVVDTL